MPNQPTSFRYPFQLPSDVHPQVKNAMRLTYQGVKDLNDAIRALHSQVQTNTTIIETVQSAASVAPSPPPAPAPLFGFVNLQPNLTPGAYTLAQADFGGLILVQSGIAFALTLNSGLMTPFFTTIYNLGAGLITATPSLGNVNNVASFPVPTNNFSIMYFDGTDWWATAGSSSVNFADGETVAGSGTAFTLAHTPNPALSLILVQYLAGFGGITLIAGTDYTLAGAAVTTVNTIGAGALTAWYRY